MARVWQATGEDKQDIRDKLASRGKDKEGLRTERNTLSQRLPFVPHPSLSGHKRPPGFEEASAGPIYQFHEQLQALGKNLSLPDDPQELVLSISNIEMPQLLVTEFVYWTLMDNKLVDPKEFTWVRPVPDETRAMLISKELIVAIAADVLVDDSEGTMHTNIDTVLAPSCNHAFRGRKRNKRDLSRSSTQRADFYIPVSVSGMHVVVFRGEDDALQPSCSPSHPS